MKHVQIFEDFYSGTIGDEYPRNEYSRRGEYRFNMLPKDLKDEFPRSVREVLMNYEGQEWDELNYILPKIEKLMQKTGLEWKRFPAIQKISRIKNFTNFLDWLKGGYYASLEEAYFGTGSPY